MDHVTSSKKGGVVTFEPEPDICDADRISSISPQSLRDSGVPEEVVQNFERYCR